uniref:Uncharacterized protein n=1 Tax=Elaeophora elaphi TaxID=1147741 RepID=A0A0R3RT36_9BILA
MIEEQSSQTDSSNSYSDKRSQRNLESLSKFRNRSRGTGSSNGFGRLYSSPVKEPLFGRGHRYINNRIPRQRNNSFTSQTSSIAESIKEQSDVEGGSGERTPTNDDHETISNFSGQKNDKGEGCYLDEELPLISRGFFFFFK